MVVETSTYKKMNFIPGVSFSTFGRERRFVSITTIKWRMGKPCSQLGWYRDQVVPAFDAGTTFFVHAFERS